MDENNSLTIDDYVFVVGIDSSVGTLQVMVNGVMTNDLDYVADIVGDDILSLVFYRLLVLKFKKLQYTTDLSQYTFQPEDKIIHFIKDLLRKDFRAAETRIRFRSEDFVVKVLRIPYDAALFDDQCPLWLWLGTGGLAIQKAMRPLKEVLRELSDNSCKIDELAAQNLFEEIFWAPRKSWLKSLIESQLTFNLTGVRVNDNSPMAQALLSAPYQDLFHPFSSPDSVSTVIASPTVTDLLTPLQMLITMIDIFRTNFNSTYHYAPFFAIIQGSGSGKTRLAVDCRSSYLTIYICLRSTNESGFPPRSSFAGVFIDILKDLHVKADEKEHDVGGYLVFYYVLFKYIANHAKDCVTFNGTNHNDRLESFMDNFFRYFASPTDEWGVWQKITNDITKTQEVTQIKVVEQINLARTAMQSIGVTSPFLVVIDEVGKMLLRSQFDDSITASRSDGTVQRDPFILWRRALSTIHSENMFHVVLDTHSTVSNLYPSAVNDKSARRRQGLRLLPPFYQFPFTGKWELPLRDDELAVHSKAWDHHGWQLQFNSPLHLLQFSRPIYFVNTQDKGSLESTLSLARLKLLGPHMKYIEKFDEQIMFPILAYRYHLTASDPILRQHLVSSHSATLIAFDRSKPESVKVEYVPEPVIGEAAARVVYDIVTKVTELEMLYDMLMNGSLSRLVSVGTRGELVSCAYLLHLFELAAVSDRFLEKSITEPKRQLETDISCFISDPIPVHTFLEKIIGIKREHAGKLLDIFHSDARPSHCNECLLQMLMGGLAFTGWYTSIGRINLKKIERAYCGRNAWIADVGEKSIDLVIPLPLPNKLPTIRPVQHREKQENESDEDEDQRTKRIKKDMGDETHPITNSLSALSFCASTPPLPPPPSQDARINMDLQQSFSAAPVQIKYRSGAIALGTAINWCVKQVEFIRETIEQTKTKGILSILHMVGPGLVCTKELEEIGEKCGYPRGMPPSVLLITLDSHPQDLFVVINGFSGVNVECNELYRQIAQMSAVYYFPARGVGATLAEARQTTGEIDTFMDQLTDFGKGVHELIQGDAIQKNVDDDFDSSIEVVPNPPTEIQPEACFKMFPIRCKNGWMGYVRVYVR